MKLKILKKSQLYLLITIIGIVLILIGIFLLVNAFSENDNSEITIKSILLFLWILFTISNFFLYKKERKNEEIE
ncbi:MAG: hypothetical protein ACTHK0_15540 [Ginsengibacter sp.]